MSVVGSAPQADWATGNEAEFCTWNEVYAYGNAGSGKQVFVLG